ncbi:hypothetical protein L3Y21_gp009 [Gordonia phage Rabbitrun]|uniref:Uncharacterized protein n=1 Tax=Gordonia phage Rabbitrun TaxID=2762280 RepID=A0A7G8LII1_9CAUD|nr:hypothetical protein L3Y21_gp009 [Gordonia phage Rabbitrun]QNJ57053.1 hypothetical protein SEA_RABBITRUN_9 [Gordonia phage Rabbitrun]
MKVRVEVTLDIDTESWSANYGIEGGAEIRKDVKAHAAHTLTETFRDMGLLAD